MWLHRMSFILFMRAFCVIFGVICEKICTKKEMKEAFPNKVNLFRKFPSPFGTNISVDESAVFLKHILLPYFTRCCKDLINSLMCLCLCIMSQH